MKLRYRIPLFAAAALAALVGGYVAVRSVQFVASKSTPLDVMPPGADAYVRIVDIDGLFERYRAGGLRALFRDRNIRPDVEAFLKDAGLPPLDKLDDEQFLKTKEGRLLRTVGRDGAAAVKERPDGSKRIVAAFRLGYVEFLLSPLASMAPGLLGGARETVGGVSAIRIEGGARPSYAVVSGRLVVVSDDPDMLAKALDPSNRFEPLIAGAGVADASPGVRLEIRLGPGSAMSKKTAQFVYGFPQGPAIHYVDLEGARGIVASFDLGGPRVFGEVRIVGGRATGSASTDVAAMLNLAPPNACLVQPTRARGEDLWRWVLEAMKTDVSENDPMYFTKSEMSDSVRLLSNAGFKKRVLEPLQGPSLLMLTVEKAPEDYTRARGQPFLNRVLVFRAETPAKAEQAFTELCGVVGEITETDPELKGKSLALEPGEYNGAKVRTLAVKNAPTELVKIIQPCFAVHRDTLIVSMNEASLRKVVDAAAGSGLRFADGDLWRSMRGPLQEGGLGDLLASPGFSAMVASGPLIKSGNEHFIVLTAEYIENSADEFSSTGVLLRQGMRSRIRAAIQNEWRAQGRRFSEDDLADEVKERVRANVARRANDMRRGLTFVEHVSVAALRAEATPTGFMIRWSLTLN